MEHLQLFLRLALWASEGALVAWPVTVVLFIWLAIAAVRQGARAVAARRWVLVQLAPVAFPVLLLILGTVFACEHCTPPEWNHRAWHPWAAEALDVLLVLQLGAAIGLVAFSRGTRILSAAVQCALLWCSFWSGMMAGMSITGDWI